MTETEDKPKAIQELEALDDALGALKEDGHDADIERLGPAIAVFDDIIQTAKDGIEDGSLAESEEVATEELIDIRDAVESVAAGDADDETLDVAEEGLEVVGKQMQLVLLKQALGAA